MIEVGDGLRISTDRVGVIIVNWNSSADTERCISEIHRLYPTMKVVVVDNGSSSGDRSSLQALAHPTTVILRDQNGGYAAGVNAGIRSLAIAGVTWAWLMNPDATPQPGSLEELLSRSDGAVALSPRQYSSSTDGAAATYPSAAYIRRGRVRSTMCEGCSVGQHEVDVVTGTGLIVSIADAMQVGLFDESFFHYKEEFEFIERVSALGAIRLVCNASVWHRRGGSLAGDSPKAAYFRTRNEILYLRKTSRYWFATPRLGRYLLRTVGRTVTASSAHRRSTLEGLIDGLSGTGGPGRSR
jgi:GT2 family glycosyltransferase